MSGLLYVSARPFVIHAQSSAVSAIKHLVRSKQGKLRLYDVLQFESPEPLSGLALAIVNDLPTFKSKAASVLQALPKVPRDVITSSATVRANFAEAIKTREVREKEELESSPAPFLPPELQPVLQESGLPQLPDNHDPDTLIWDDDDQSDFGDDGDVKNTEDFDPDQDPEAKFYTEHVDAWMKADVEDCVRGAKPRFYSHLEVGVANDNASAADDIEPNYESSCSHDSTLLPYLFIHEILGRQDLNAQKGEEEEEEKIKDLVKRYRYLTSVDGYRQVKLFKQEDPASPRWLMIQEFTDLYIGDTSLKKKEAEYWWRKNGCDGVIVEFFHRCESQ